MRTETRKERYNRKALSAQVFPVELACPNLQTDENVGYLARSCAVMGAQALNIIGKIPERSILKKYSAGQSELINIRQHKDPIAFIEDCKKRNVYLICAELTDDAVSLYETSLIEENKISVIMLGHESFGTPVDILKASSKIVYIPQLGPGFTLNTAITGAIFLSSYIEKHILTSQIQGSMLQTSLGEL
jgi:tRNA G18 (ribose-2'-O)-methylase SpoU